MKVERFGVPHDDVSRSTAFAIARHSSLWRLDPAGSKRTNIITADPLCLAFRNRRDAGVDSVHTSSGQVDKLGGTDEGVRNSHDRSRAVRASGSLQPGLSPSVRLGLFSLLMTPRGFRSLVRSRTDISKA